MENTLEEYSLETSKKSNWLVWPVTALAYKLILNDVFKKQVFLAKLARQKKTTLTEIHKVQVKLAKTLNFRMHAIFQTFKKLQQNFRTIKKMWKEKFELLYWLKINITNKYYKNWALTRVFTKKVAVNNPQLVSLLVLKDYALQELMCLILDPLIENLSGAHNYGYRNFRFSKNAIEVLERSLNFTKEVPWILKTNISLVFTELTKKWVLKHICLPRIMLVLLKGWFTVKKSKKDLKVKNNCATFTLKNKLICILLNFLFNGLEKTIRKCIRFIFIKLIFVRYINVIIIVCSNLSILCKYVKAAIVKFLHKRGFLDNTIKTSMLTLAQNCLDFLGYSFKYKNLYFRRSTISYEIFLYPEKKWVRNLLKKIYFLCKRHNNVTASYLIFRLNSIIWKYIIYYNIRSCTNYLRQITYVLFKYLWRWVKQKHPRWNKMKLLNFYFLSQKNNLMTAMLKKKQSWFFYGTFFFKKLNFLKKKIVYLILPLQKFKKLQTKNYKIPKFLYPVCGYSENYMHLKAVKLKINLYENISRSLF